MGQVGILQDQKAWRMTFKWACLWSLLKEWKLHCNCYRRMFFILGFRSWWIMYKGFLPPPQFQMIELLFFQLCRHQLSSCLSLVQLSPQSSRRHAVSFTWKRGESLTLYSIQNIFNKLYIITRQCSLLVSHQEDNEETACLMVQLKISTIHLHQLYC